MFTRNIALRVSGNKEFIEASIERKKKGERKGSDVNRYCERCKPSVCIYGATVELEVFEFELEFPFPSRTKLHPREIEKHAENEDGS